MFPMRWIATAALCIAALGATPALLAQGPDLSDERALFIKLRPSAERGNWSAAGSPLVASPGGN